MKVLQMCLSAVYGALAVALTTLLYPAARANPEWFMYLCWLLATIAFQVGMPLVFRPIEAQEVPESSNDIENVFNGEVI